MADSQRLAVRLHAAGHQVIISPVLELAALQALPEQAACDAIVATSSNAFALLSKDSVPQEFLTRPVYVVGARTAETAVATGFTKPDCVAANAARLVDAIKQQIVPGSRLCYLAGKDRKPDLEDNLREAGYAVDILVTYEALAAAALSAEACAELTRGGIDAVLHFSRRSAEIFVRLARRADIEPAARAATHVCISQDAAKGLAALKPFRTVMADIPDVGGVLARLASADI